MALAWEDRSADLTVRRLRTAHLEPALADVMSPRFLTLPAAAAYAVAGSFCHFLVEQYGIAPLTRVYQAGGGPAAWQAAYGTPLSSLGQAWSRTIDALPSPGQPAWHLRQPSVFRRPCAHEIALLRQAAADATRAGDLAGALAILEDVCQEAPGDPASVAAVLAAAWQMGDLPRATSLANDVLRADPTPWLHGRAETLLGDLALAGGHNADAAAHYRIAETMPLDDAEARLVTVKRVLATRPPPIPAVLVQLLLPRPWLAATEPDASVQLLQLDRLVRDHLDDSLLAYLLARQLENCRAFAEAAQLFSRSRSGSLPDARFIREAANHEALDHLRTGDFDEADAAFVALSAADPDEAAVTALGRARVQWSREHTQRGTVRGTVR